MRPLVVVEVHGSGHRSCDFSNAGEAYILEQFILHRAVDAFRLCIVLRVSGFRHADVDVIVVQQPGTLGRNGG